MNLLDRINYIYNITNLKLAQVIDKTKVHHSSIDNFSDRIAASNKPEWDFTYRKIPQSGSSQNNKPLGVWYAFGTQWIRLINEQSGYAYRLKIDESKIIKLNNINIKFFIKEYSATISGADVARSLGVDVDNLPLSKKIELKYIFEPKQVIDWEKVASRFQGVEIADISNFDREVRQNNDFLSSWDIDSGCIWDTSAIKDAKKLGKIPSFQENSEDEFDERFRGYWNEGTFDIKMFFENKNGLVLGSSLEPYKLQFLSTNLIQYNIHLTADQLANVIFRVSPSSLILEKVPDAPSYEGKVINFE